MYKILGQLHFDSSLKDGNFKPGTPEYNEQQRIKERGEYRILYRVPDNMCATCTIYVTRFRGDTRAGSTDKQYKIHIIKKADFDANPYCTEGTAVPANNTELPTRPAHTSIGPDDIACTAKQGDKKNILVYFPERENKDYPDIYTGISLDAGDAISVFVRNGEYCFQVFGLELPNDLDTRFRTMMIALTNAANYFTNTLGPSVKNAADYYRNTLGPTMNVFFSNHAYQMNTDVQCCSCPSGD